MVPSNEGERAAREVAERSHGLLRIVLLGVAAVSAAVVATARPVQGLAVAPVATEAACGEPAFSLPPGHPPLSMFGPLRPGAALPPGHPSIDGPVVKAPRLPGLGPEAPAFEAPGIVEI